MDFQLKCFQYLCFKVILCFILIPLNAHVLVGAQELSTFESAILPNFSFQYSPDAWSVEEEFHLTSNLPDYIIKLRGSGLEDSFQINVNLPRDVGWEVNEELFISTSELGFVGDFIRVPSLIDKGSFYYIPKSLGFNTNEAVMPYPIRYPMFIPISKDFLFQFNIENYWNSSEPAAWLNIDLKTNNPEFIAAAELIVASLQLTLCNDSRVCEDEK